jgi:uncharacterized cupin superfamily protein
VYPSERDKEADVSSKKGHPCLLRVADRPAEAAFAHPLNPDSDMHGVSLSEQVGLQRVGVHVVRIPPGKESAIFHSHRVQEEFFLILSGRGVAEIDDGTFEVGPGDFMGFPTPSAAHHLKNPFDEDLVYLVGGERGAVEIAEFPRLGKMVFRDGDEAFTVDKDRLELFWKQD